MSVAKVGFACEGESSGSRGTRRGSPVLRLPLCGVLSLSVPRLFSPPRRPSRLEPDSISVWDLGVARPSQFPTVLSLLWTGSDYVRAAWVGVSREKEAHSQLHAQNIIGIRAVAAASRMKEWNSRPPEKKRLGM